MLTKRLVFVIGIVVFTLVLRISFVLHNARSYSDKEPVTIRTMLLTDIDTYNKKSSLSVLLPDTFPPQRCTIYLPSGANLHYGQYIEFSGNISSRTLDNGNVFLAIYSPHIRIIPRWFDIFFSLLYLLRKNIVEGYQLTLSDIDSSLLLGIVFGIKEDMPKTFSQQLQQELRRGNLRG